VFPAVVALEQAFAAVVEESGLAFATLQFLEPEL
jgi:hypothetical protein